MGQTFDFRHGPVTEPFYIWKPYGPAAPWPVDRPATWITKPYGPASAAPPPGPEANWLIPPPGVQVRSVRAVLPPVYDATLPTIKAPISRAPVARRPGLEGWWQDQWDDAKRFADKNPWMLGIFYTGAIILALRLTSLAKG